MARIRGWSVFCRFMQHRIRTQVKFELLEFPLYSVLAHEYQSYLSVDLFVMIEPQERFLSLGQSYFGSRDNPITQTECNVWDWDQLRLIKVKGTARYFEPREDIEISVLAPLADYLSPEVRAITVNDDGLLTGSPPIRKRTIHSLLDIPPFHSVHHSNIALRSTFLSFKSLIDSVQLSISYRTMIRCSPSNSNLSATLEDQQFHGMK